MFGGGGTEERVNVVDRTERFFHFSLSMGRKSEKQRKESEKDFCWFEWIQDIFIEEK